MVNQERLLQRFLTYVKCGSESGSERSFCLLLEAELRTLGLTPSRQEIGETMGSNGWNVHAFRSGLGKPLLFSAHMDTVSPGSEIEPVVENGRVSSRGETILGADDKAGIAAIMEALQCLKDNSAPERSVEVLFTIGEEIGMLGAKNALYSDIRSLDAVVLDFEDVGQVINRTPSHVNFSVSITGKSAHAAMGSAKGVHALKAAAEIIAAIPCGIQGERTVINVANLQAPGKINVVPDKASFQGEIRSYEEATLQSHLASIQKTVSDICQRYGAKSTFEIQRIADAQYTPEESPLIQEVQAAWLQTGVTPSVVKTFGGSDAIWLNANGLRAINVGIGMADAHSTSESIAVADLVATANMVLSLMRG